MMEQMQNGEHKKRGQSFLCCAQEIVAAQCFHNHNDEDAGSILTARVYGSVVGPYTFCVLNQKLRVAASQLGMALM